MRVTRPIAALAAAGIAASMAVAAGPTPGGITSDNVEWVGYVPFDVGTATGMTIRNDLAFVTSWRSVSIYDITDKRNPVLLNTTPFGFRFENEDVAGNDELLIFSETLPTQTLHVYDISHIEAGMNPAEAALPLEEIATINNAGDHTSECLHNCEYVFGSEGTITYLGQTAENVRAGNWELLDDNWMDLMGEGVFSNHDVEVFNDGGYFVTTPISRDAHVVDARDPLNPVIVGRLQHPDPSGWLYHSGDWFNDGHDKFVLMQGENNFQAQCTEAQGPMVLLETDTFIVDPETNHFYDGVSEEGAKVTERIANGSESAAADYPFQSQIRDIYSVANGNVANGSPPATALGCSAHWFQEQPDFKNGGLVAVGYYEHGTRFLEVTPEGRLNEVGFFLPAAGSGFAAYWVDERTVYHVDVTRGIDILEWTGPIVNGDGEIAPAL